MPNSNTSNIRVSQIVVRGWGGGGGVNSPSILDVGELEILLGGIFLPGGRNPRSDFDDSNLFQR